MKLSICMMVKNEEKNLERCLEPFVALKENHDVEIVIVDTGSTDKTVDIAKKYTERVYFKEWFDDFSGMRNYTISLAKGEWIFILDADEVISNVDELLNTIDKVDNTIGAIGVKINSIIFEEKDITTSANLVRIFRNGHIKYDGLIHEQARYDGKNYLSTIELMHYGYLQNDKALVERKVNRGITLLEKGIKKQPDNLYYYFQLSRTYDMNRDFERSYDTIKQAIDKLSGRYNSGVLYIYAQYIAVLKSRNKLKELIKVAENILSKEKTHIDILFNYGLALILTKRLEKGIEILQGYLKIVKNRDAYSIFKDETLEFVAMNSKFIQVAYREIAMAYLELGEFESSLEWFQKMEVTETEKNYILTFVKTVLMSKGNAHYYFEMRKLLLKRKLTTEVRDIDDYFELYYKSENHIELSQIKDIKQYLNVEELYDAVLYYRLEEEATISAKTIAALISIEDKDYKACYGELFYKAIQQRKIEKVTVQPKRKVQLYNYIASTYKDGLDMIWLYEEMLQSPVDNLLLYFQDTKKELLARVYARIIIGHLNTNSFEITWLKGFLKDDIVSIFNCMIEQVDADQDLLLSFIEPLELSLDEADKIFEYNLIIDAILPHVTSKKKERLAKSFFKCVKNNYRMEVEYKYNLDKIEAIIDYGVDPLERFKLMLYVYLNEENQKKKLEYIEKISAQYPKMSQFLLMEAEGVVQDQLSMEIEKMNEQLINLGHLGQYQEAFTIYDELIKMNMYNSRTVDIIIALLRDIGDYETAEQILVEKESAFVMSGDR